MSSGSSTAKSSNDAPTWAHDQCTDQCTDQRNDQRATHAKTKHVSRERARRVAGPRLEPAPTARCLDWRVVDRALRTIATKRAALDADEARWLREAEALQIWRRLGMVNAIDYMERVLGYAPRAAQDRLRVARALGGLPVLEAALAHGELPFTAVRELTRVATRQTEDAWLREARGKNVHQIEELVAGHRPGDTPDDPKDPDVRSRTITLELTPEAYAVFRQGAALLNEEHGRHLDDSDLIIAAFSRPLEARLGRESTGRAKYQIAITLCARCRQGWQDGAGAQIAIGAAAVERAECDAQHIGSLDADVPARATQGIPPAVARRVWRRDHGRCRIPGCRSTRSLEFHHLRHRADGGTHDEGNIILACGCCHLAHHDGRLEISGTADNLIVRRLAEEYRLPLEVDAAVADEAIGGMAGGDEASGEMAGGGGGLRERRTDASASDHRAHVGAFEAAAARAQAKDALTRMGYKAHVAREAIEAAITDLGQLPLEQLVIQALRRCGRR